MASAWLAFCSTSRIDVPVAWIADDRLEDVVHEVGREAHRGLVEEQHAGLGHERASHGQHLLLTAREQCPASWPERSFRRGNIV